MDDWEVSPPGLLRAESLEDRVKGRLREQAAEAGMSLDDYRSMLAAQPRYVGTLQRRAAKLGTSMRQLLDEDRRLMREATYPGPECIRPHEVELFAEEALTEDRLEHTRRCIPCGLLLEEAAPPVDAAAAVQAAKEIRTVLADSLVVVLKDHLSTITPGDRVIENQLSDRDRVVVERAMGMVGIPVAPPHVAEMKGSDDPVYVLPQVPIPTADKVYMGFHEETGKYAKWLEAMLGGRDVEKAAKSLTQIRVLDVTIKGVGGHWCSSLLAEHDAEVIVVEPPRGTPSYGRGRMFKEYQISKMAESQFLSQARNTLSITLNLETPEGRELLKKLAVTVDVLIEDYPPGQFDEWGIGYLKLSQINPRLVYGWIGRWGQGGPPDDRMSRVSEYVAGEFLAMEILTALTYREHVSGRGQFVNATGAGAIMRTIEYRTPLSPLTEEPRSKSKWLGRPIGFDNEDVYRRMFGVKKDEFDRLKKEGVI
jgi:hypothetical protein